MIPQPTTDGEGPLAGATEDRHGVLSNEAAHRDPRLHVSADLQEQGEPFFLQPPALRGAVHPNHTTHAGSSTDPPRHDREEGPESQPLVPSNISDLEDRADRAAER